LPAWRGPIRRRRALRSGKITFHYSPASWQFAREGERLVATCVQEDCAGAVIDISRREGEDGCTKEAVAAEAERLFPRGERHYANTMPAGRFAIALAVRHDGPELSSPAFAYGCVPWQGSEYRFAMRPETVGSQAWIEGALQVAGAPQFTSDNSCAPAG
jgi:hypothetical protein